MGENSWNHVMGSSWISVGLALLGKCRSGRPASPISVGWWLGSFFFGGKPLATGSVWGRWRFRQGRHFGAQRARLEVWTVCWSPGVQGLLSSQHYKKGGVNTVDGRNPANPLRLVAYPCIYRLLYIPGGTMTWMYLRSIPQQRWKGTLNHPVFFRGFRRWIGFGPLTLTHRSPGLSTGALVLRRVEMGEMGERHVRKLMDLIHVHALKWEKLRCIMSEMFLIERFLVTCGWKFLLWYVMICEMHHLGFLSCEERPKSGKSS